MIPRYPSMIKMLERSYIRERASRLEIHDANHSLTRIVTRTMDIYEPRYEWKFWPSSAPDQPTRVCLPSTPISILKEMDAMLGGKSVSIAVNRRPFTPVVLFESSRRMESYVAQKCRDFSHRTTSVPLTWMARARLSLKPRTEKERNDKKEGGRGEEEKKEGRKEERSASRAFSRGGEGEGNSKEAGISSAFAWKYRSRDGIPIDRIFRNGEILQSLPSLLSRFIIFRLYHLPLLITVNGN